MGTISTPAAVVPDEWDFYVCRVDDAPASIMLNMWFGRNAPIETAGTLYWCAIEMLRPDANGMGDEAERKALQVVEDRFGEWAQQRGLYFVGRMRNSGTWQLTYYGPPGRQAELEAKAAEELRGKKRKLMAGSREDPAWSYYFEFLWPDAERLQWMADRRVVASLEQHGDPLVQPRRIDHWIYFGSAANRDAFVEVVTRDGFTLQESGEGAGGERPFSAHIYRMESVQLDDIHATVMSLVELAQEHRGEYDGWETSVEKPRPN